MRRETKDIVSEETLDPEDWKSIRQLGHKMLDDMLDYMKTVRERPVWQHAPDKVKAHFNRPLPRDPQPTEEIYQEFVEKVLPYPLGNIHPCFWGWVLGTGTVFWGLGRNAGSLDEHNVGRGLPSLRCTCRKAGD